MAPRGDLRRLDLPGGKVLVDGGRQIEAGATETFTLACARGKPATLVMRAAGPGPVEAGLTVDGQAAGLLKGHVAGPMGLVRVDIDSRLLDGDRITVRLTAHKPYSSYHLWLVQ